MVMLLVVVESLLVATAGEYARQTEYYKADQDNAQCVVQNA
jgi:hypothetical protein